MSSQPKTILVVDDDRSIRHLLSEQLKALGYRCATVSNGQEALARLAQQGVGLVLLDISMPGMSGLDVLRRVRADHPRTRVIMLTALADSSLATQALRLGADDYMTKPYTLKQLTSRVERALGNKAPLSEGKISDSSLRAEERMSIEEREVTKDLINQQVSVFQQLTEPTDTGKPGAKRPRRSKDRR